MNLGRMPRTRRIACSTGARDLPPARVAVSPVHLLPLGPGALHDHRSRCVRHATRSARDAQATTRATHPRRPAGGQRGDGQGVRRRPVPRTARCAAVRLGVGADLGRRRAGRCSSTSSPDRRHGRLPPPLHPPLVQGQPRPCGSRWPSLGSMALQGPVISWVADHRRHHAFTDKEGDPHSPWLFGTTPAAVARGFWHAHFGWMFRPDRTNPARFAPDLLADPDIARINRQFPCWTAVSLVAPAASRRAAQLVVVGRADRVLLGRAGADRRAAPRDLVGQLDLPHDRRPAVRPTGPLHELLAAGDRCRWASPGTTCTTPTPPAPGTVSAAARSTSRPGSSRSSSGSGWAYDVRWPTPRRLARLTASRGRRS